MTFGNITIFLGAPRNRAGVLWTKAAARGLEAGNAGGFYESD